MKMQLNHEYEKIVVPVQNQPAQLAVVREGGKSQKSGRHDERVQTKRLWRKQNSYWGMEGGKGLSLFSPKSFRSDARNFDFFRLLCKTASYAGQYKTRQMSRLRLTQLDTPFEPGPSIQNLQRSGMIKLTKIEVLLFDQKLTFQLYLIFLSCAKQYFCL